jgi:hypothetical protein
MANTFKFGNGNWAVKEDYALAYNDENGNFKPLPFDFTRASSATRVNKDGLIETVPSGKPRIDFTDNTSGHLLLEASRTNYLRYSEDLSQSNWVKTNTGTGVAPTVTANYAISPDGSQNASRVQFDINGGTTISDRSRLYQDAGTGTSGNQAYSVYVKSNDSSSHTIVFRALGGAFNVKTVTTEWQRIDMAATDNSFYFELGLYGDSATADTADILVWGAQMEEGSYATSYIPTEGSSVTRSAEEANGAGNSTVFNDSEGVLYAEIAALANDGGNRRLGISDGDLSDRVVIGFTSSDNQIQAVVSNSGTQANITHTTSDVLSYNKIAFKYKANDFALWVNGTEVGIDGNGTAPSGLNQALFNEGGGALDFYGKVKDFRLYDTALSDSELQALTS